MKLKNLNDRISPITGEDDPKVRDAMPTYKNILLLTVGNVASDNVTQTEAAYRLLTTLKATDDKLDLEEGDVALLKLIVGQNPLKFPVAIMGAVLEKIKDVDK